MDELYETTEVPDLSGSGDQSPEPTEPSRAVYDSDISDSILAKLSAYYREHADGDADYAIFRSGQYQYYLVFGDYSSGTFSDSTLVSYTIEYSGYQTTGARVYVSTGTYTPDLSGSTGYVYSSVPGYLPSRYIEQRALSSIRYQHVTSVVICLCFILCVIGLWMGSFRRRLHR